MRLLIILLHLAIAAVGNEEGVGLPGHMQPIGSHRPPEDSISILSYVPNPLEFYEEYVTTHTPVLFKGAILDTPALTKWRDDEYLSISFGEEIVDLEIGKKENRTSNTDRTTLADFLKRYKEEDIYLVNDMPVGMQKEWQVPRCLLCGGYTDFINFCYIWFSSGGTKSVLHTDAYENLHCLASGIKEFVLIEPKYINLIGSEHGVKGYYDLDVEKVDMTLYPRMMEIPWYYVRVEPGDCLYIPFNWIHHVSSHDRNLGVNIWWSSFSFERDKCPKDLNEVPDFMSLSQFQLRPEKQIESMFMQIVRDDGFVYADDLLEMLPPGYEKEGMYHIFDILEPGCNGKLLLSKLLEDQVLQERYQSLREFIEPAEPNGEDGDMIDEEWHDGDDGMDWQKNEPFQQEGINDGVHDDDDIEVPSKEDVDQFLKHHSGKQKFSTNHNEL